jgi:hypothetical protein
MKRHEPAVPRTACTDCSADLKTGDFVLCLGKMTAIQSQLTDQAAEGDWNAVATTAHRGTFLIRRRTGSSMDSCPLRIYDIRHIEAVSPPGRERHNGVEACHSPAEPGWMENRHVQSMFE